MSDTMKALVYRGPEKIAVEDIPVPKIIEADDAIVRVTTSTICGPTFTSGTGECRRLSRAELSVMNL